MPRGVPQIEVFFDIDVSGILTVSAREMSAGKEQKITIRNDKERMSADEIERLVQEAERYKAEDTMNRARIEAKNSLENYAYQVRNTLADESVSEKLSSSDKSKINQAINETMRWLDSNQEAGKEEFEEKQKRLESEIFPLLQNLSGDGGMFQGMPGASAPAPNDEPKIEEID
jgi:heat shock 70kDa protein 1/2/6/8